MSSLKILSQGFWNHYLLFGAYKGVGRVFSSMECRSRSRSGSEEVDEEAGDCTTLADKEEDQPKYLRA